MALYVIVSEKCNEDAAQHAQGHLIEKLKDNVERSQSLTGFNAFLPTPFLKKGLGRSYRLLAYRAPVGSDELILFLRVMARGSNEYEHFLDGWKDNTDQLTGQLQPYSEAELQKIHARLTAAQPPAPIPEPDSEERAWLYEVFQVEAPTDELLVLESESWVKKMRAPSYRDFLALYHQLLENLDLETLHAAVEVTDCHTHWGRNGGLGVAYLYRPDLQRLLLLEPLRNVDDSDALLEEHRERLAKTQDGRHDLSRVAARSYPFLMVLDQDAWLAIQKDEEANLALSPEEAELLESVRRAGAAGELGYPLFINGRAGSGKSTMLQYLAADYIDFALRKSAPHRPLYMTCSPDLLDRARETVHGLLTAHHERLLKGAHDPAVVRDVLQRSFVVFHDFLYLLLPENIQSSLSPDRYVNYAVFRRLWVEQYAKRPEARKISPDVAWHTLRSYIKGIRSGHDDELGPEEFRAMPRRRRSVSEETYREVYDRVWCSWYRRLRDDQGYWDDQDLAAYVVESGRAAEIDCPAVFCDEAQDFTPIELDIIFQLSLFGRRSLQPEELRRVPIVFAGDPLQTINPTGFRWDAVQADFHERFCAVLDPRRRAKIEVSYRELRFNYRSNPGIVNFCNLVQLARAALLGARDIQPQEAWWVDAPVQTVWFAADNAQTEQQIRQRPELVKLVNCEEGEESNYVKADPILRGLNEEADGIYRNVLGPTRAKGLEFPAVVLYRFGETAPADFQNLLQGRVKLETQEDRLPYEYFLNRLYVAASRAKGQLVVVDSNSALRAFWRFASDAELIDGLMARSGGVDLWSSSVTYLVPGREEAWSGERIDPREQAAEYAEQGRRKRDPYLMRQAALAYRSAKDKHKAGKCFAFADELEGKLEEAGDKYGAIDLQDEAFRCYWEGRHWHALCDLAAKNSELTARLQARAADCMHRGRDLPGAFLQELVRACSDETWLTSVSRDPTWRAVLGELGDRLSKVAGSSDITWSDLRTAFMKLASAGIRLRDDQLAVIAYGAKDYEDAVRLWDRSTSKKGDPYWRAKAHVDPFPTNLKWLAQLKQDNEILRQWGKNERELRASDLDEGVARTVAGAAINQRKLDVALRILDLKPVEELLARLLNAALSAAHVETTSEAAVIAARHFVQTARWKDAIRAAEKLDFSGLSDLRSKNVQAFLKDAGSAVRVRGAVVGSLARSSALTTANADRQKEVTSFLRRHFSGKNPDEFERYGLTAVEVGAAIERSGKIVEAIQFYEDLCRSASDKSVVAFAAERLVKSHERYAEHLEATGQPRMADKRRGQAKRVRKEKDVAKQHIPEYPLLTEQESPERRDVREEGLFKIVRSRSHFRVRIEHTERFETITIDAKDQLLRGDAKFEQLEPSGSEAAAWKVAGWDTVVKLFVDKGRVRVAVIPREGRSFEVGLDGASQP